MNTSEQINDLAAALAKSQAELRSAVKNATNPFLKSKYADLASVIECSRETLTSNEIAVAQAVGNDGNLVTVTTRLIHSSGQWIESTISAQPKGQDPQSVGSVMTYLRRYGYAALVGIATEDDDGSAATPARGEGTRKAPPPEPDHGPMPVLADNLRKRLHAVGTETYGMEWDAKRAELVRAATGGKYSSSNNLTEDQAHRLIRGMEGKQPPRVGQREASSMSEWTAPAEVQEGSAQKI